MAERFSMSEHSPMLTRSGESTKAALTIDPLSESVTLTTVQVLSHHTSDVNCVTVAGGLFATCSGDKTVHVFKYENKDNAKHNNPYVSKEPLTPSAPMDDDNVDHVLGPVNEVSVEAADQRTIGDHLEEVSYSPLRDHKYQVIACHLSSRSSLLVTCSVDGMARVYSAQDGTPVVAVQHAGAYAMRTCRLSPRANLLATGCMDGSLCVWDVGSTLPKIKIIEAHEMSILACDFSPNHLWLVTGCSSGHLKVWDAQYFTPQPILTRSYAHDMGMSNCHFSPVVADDFSCQLASCGQDCQLRTWTLYCQPRVKLEETLSLEGHSGPIYACQFSPSGLYVASGGVDYSIRLWDSVFGECLCVVGNAHSKFVNSLAFTEDETMLFSTSTDKTVKLWAIDGLRPLTPLPAVEEEKASAADDSVGMGKWSVADVCKWLTAQDLPPDCVDIFSANQIDGRELSVMTDEKLDTGLKIAALGTRNKICRAIKREMFLPHSDLMTSDSVIPHEFFCPITHELMVDPVVVSDGYSYEREAIQSWISNQAATSPLTNSPLKSTVLTPNRNLLMLIRKWQLGELDWMNTQPTKS